MKKIYSVFSFPSLYEECPNTVCEAMACGLPILCSNVCDNSMLVEEGKNGFLFDPYLAEDIAGTISRYIQLSVEDKKRMSRESRRIAIRKYSEEAFLIQYLEILK